jgi:hypothetical protein
VAVTWGRQEITASGELFTPRAGKEASETLVSCRLLGLVSCRFLGLGTVEFRVKVEIVEWESKSRNHGSKKSSVQFYGNVRSLIALCACVK